MAVSQSRTGQWRDRRQARPFRRYRPARNATAVHFIS